MSSDRSGLSLSVRGLGKRYRIAKTQGAAAPSTLAESLLSFFDRKGHVGHTEFWANRDISFDLKEGDIVGIVGRNGAGKSTLLKLLSRITEPTEGEIDLYGRVGSLLEVGTGFHPELTGRENIFLNGAILGMHRSEITRQFDAIVEFAEIEPFLDVPVKRYSSGMYVRLAFAVAAHLNPEILIVDEVLAVGDARFQQKCLGKMKDVARSGGRTVLFVSHNMAAVRSLCNRAVFLKEGRLALDASTEAATDLYLSDAWEATAEREIAPGASDRKDFHISAVRIHEANGTVVAAVDLREPFIIEIEYVIISTLSNLRVAFEIQTAEGVTVCYSFDPDCSSRAPYPPGKYVSRCHFPAHTLNEGTFLIGVIADIPNDRVLQQVENATSFRVEDVTGHGTHREKLPGIIRPSLAWIMTHG